MPSFTETSDTVVVSPLTTTILGDAFVVEPLATIIKGDSFVLPATAFVLPSDAVLYAAGIPINVGGDGSCMPYGAQLVEGEDYELDSAGNVRFLSTGRARLVLYPEYGFCGVYVDASCLSGQCLYFSNYNQSCEGACYVQEGYDTVLQEGAESYRSDDEKILKRATFEAEPLPASTPAPLECDVAFGNQPSCMKWVPVRPLEFECQSEKSPEQHAADRTRPDDGFHFPTWIRGKYLSVRFRITGIGGGGMFSAIHKLVKGWGQHDAP